MKLDRQAIEAILPHREPFLFLDEIIEFEPGKKMAGKKSFSGKEWFFQGHFPESPVLPGVIMIEMMAQLGAVGVLFSVKDHWMYLARCEQVKFRKKVTPPAELFIYLKFGKHKLKYGEAFAWITEKGEKVCEGTLAYMLVPKK